MKKAQSEKNAELYGTLEIISLDKSQLIISSEIIQNVTSFSLLAPNRTELCNVSIFSTSDFNFTENEVKEINMTSCNLESNLIYTVYLVTDKQYSTRDFVIE